jgi:uncharacterized repeat protein (TIGR01451 family)
MILRRINTRNIRTKIAVSEIIGTLLMLGIATSSFSVIYYNISNSPVPNPAPIVEISGSISENQVVLMHRGGETLSLDTELMIYVGEKTEKIKIGDFLDNESKKDGVWNLGEKVTYPIVYNYDYLTHRYGKICVVDKQSNSLLMTGRVGIEPECDLGIKVEVDNQFPGMETNIIFTITITNNGNINETNIIVNFDIPEELFHYRNFSTKGFYENSTGLWDVGNLIPEESAVLTIEVTVGERGSEETAQLLMILDGSSSISSGDWTLQVEGLAAAVQNEEIFPHDGTVELTVIQFGGGGWSPPSPGYAKLEIGPIIVTEANNESVGDSIRNIAQLKSMTPTACGIYLGADTIAASGIFEENIRQIVILVTDGDPTQGCDCDGDYSADNYGFGYDKQNEYRYEAELARDYLIDTLGMTIDQDEFNSIAVGDSTDHAPWLKEKIVWPEPGYYAPPFLIGSPHRGWLRNVTTWEEFAETINECFGIIFNRVPVTVKISFKSYNDPKEANDLDTITIVPTSSPYVITKDATNVDDSNATLNMFYNFKWIGSGEVRFSYKEDTEDTWQYTTWVPKSGSGTFSTTITGLSPGTNFIFKAQLQYYSAILGTTIVNVKEKTLKTEVVPMVE